MVGVAPTRYLAILGVTDLMNMTELGVKFFSSALTLHVKMVAHVPTFLVVTSCVSANLASLVVCVR